MCTRHVHGEALRLTSFTKCASLILASSLISLPTVANTRSALYFHLLCVHHLLCFNPPKFIQERWMRWMKSCGHLVFPSSPFTGRVWQEFGWTRSLYVRKALSASYVTTWQRPRHATLTATVSSWLYTPWTRRGGVSATRINGRSGTDAQGCVFAQVAAEVAEELYHSQLTGDGTPGSALLAECYRWDFKCSVEF